MSLCGFLYDYRLYTILKKINASFELEHKKGVIRNLAYGAFLTLGNPVSILLWAAIFTERLRAHPGEGNEIYIFAAGCVTGTYFLDTSLGLFASLFRKVLTPHSLRYINFFSGSLMMILGAAIIMKAIII